PETDNKYELAVVIINAMDEAKIIAPIGPGKLFPATCRKDISPFIFGKSTIAVVVMKAAIPRIRTSPIKKPMVERLAAFTLLADENRLYIFWSPKISKKGGKK